MKGSDKPIPDGIWLCKHNKEKGYWVVYKVSGHTATVIKSSKLSGFTIGSASNNDGWDGGILTRWSTKHYYKLL